MTTTREPADVLADSPSNQAAPPTVLIDHPRPEVALITFNEPHTLNAMTIAFLGELRAALLAAEADAAVRVVVLTGAGRGFSSGHGLDEITGLHQQQSSVAASYDNQRAYSDLVLTIAELEKPVIAAVNGPAAGGGLAMALASDTRVCSESARFNAAFVRIGISGCDVGVSYLLPRIVGPTLAFEMMLSGRLVDADEALHSGLVLRVVPDGDVVDAALEIADSIVANSPFAVRMTRRAMWANLDAPSLRSAIALEDTTQVLCVQTGDMVDAIPAVREKRMITWPAS